MKEAMRAYETLEGRMAYLLGVADVDGTPQQPRQFPSDPDLAVKELRVQAAIMHPLFEDACVELVALFNGAVQVSDFGLDLERFRLALDQLRRPSCPGMCDPKHFPITSEVSDDALDAQSSEHDDSAMVVGRMVTAVVETVVRMSTMTSISYAPHSKRRAHLLCPGIKGEVECKKKVLMDYQGREHPASWLCDVLRATVVFADPYRMALFCAVLEQRFTVVRLCSHSTSRGIATLKM